MEQFANEAGAQLDGSITSSAVSILVKSPVNVPASGTFRARVGTEYLKVTAVSSLTWTVVRGDGGTTAASHADSSAVVVIVTKEAVDALVSIQHAGTEVANRRVLNFTGATVTDDPTNGRATITVTPLGEVLTPPVLANFTFDGHGASGTPTATQQGDAIVLYHPGFNGDYVIELYQTPPATPYTVTAKFQVCTFNWNFPTIGIYFSDGTKMTRIVYQCGTDVVQIDGYTNFNTYSGFNPVQRSATRFSTQPWLRITDDGTNKAFFIGPDGINWIPFYSQSSTAILSSTTRIGFSIGGNTGGTNNGRVVFAFLESWKVT